MTWPTTTPDFEAVQVMAAAAIIRSENLKTLHFRPTAPVNRAVVATALVKVLDLPEITPPRPTFGDVQPGRHWAYTSIETLYGHGLVAGVGGNRFAPNQPITHQQLGFLIHKAAPDLADTALHRHSQRSRPPRAPRIVPRSVCAAQASLRYLELLCGSQESEFKIQNSKLPSTQSPIHPHTPPLPIHPLNGTSDRFSPRASAVKFRHRTFGGHHGYGCIAAVNAGSPVQAFAGASV
jgi:hypothetical protein